MLVTVKVCDFVRPSTTLPKLKLVGEMLIPACVPVPLKTIVSGEPVALLVTVTAPLAAPAVVGANFTERVAVCDGANVAGVVNPLTLKPVPLALTPEIWTEAFPVFVRMTCCVELLPATILPKLMLLGFAVSCPEALEEPAPLKLTTAVPFAGSLLVNVILPLTLPAAVGEKLAVTGTD